MHIFDHSLPLHSGYTFRSYSIIKSQQDLGLNTCHVTSAKQGESQQDKETAEGLDFYRTPALSRWCANIPILNQLMTIIGLFNRLKQVITIEKPDVLHAHSPALNGIAALWAGKKFDLPVIYEVRGFWEDAAVDHGTCKEGDWRYRMGQKMETYVAKRCFALTVICEGIKKDLISRGIDQSKITIVGNAVNIESFERIKNKSDFMLNKLNVKGSYVIGFIGSFYQYEGIDDLLRGLALTKERGLNVKLLLVGGGQQLPVIQTLIDELQLHDDVILTGRIPHEDITDYYSVMDLTVLPRKSIRLTELVTPLKPLESMALGIPILASDIGGHRELITDDETGFLFKAEDAVAMADAIEAIKNDPDKVKRVVDNGRHYVETVKNWPNSVANYLGMYNKTSEL